MPGSSPARGYLLPTNRSLIRHDQVCDTPDRPAILRKLGLGSDLSKVKCTCPSSPVLPHASEKKCSTSQRQQVFQCSAMPLVPPSLERLGRVERLLHPSRARVDVLLAVSDHVGHGFFAIVERVANQVLYARASGLEPYVFVGELLFSDTAGCEHGFQAYHEAAAGDNVRALWMGDAGRVKRIEGMRAVLGLWSGASAVIEGVWRIPSTWLSTMFLCRSECEWVD